MKTIALIAHDGKKAEMVGFTKDHLERLRRFRLVATGSTGRYIEEAVLSGEKKKFVPLGGDAQLASAVVDR